MPRPKPGANGGARKPIEQLNASREANVAALQEAITEAEAIAEQRRQEAKVAAKRADDLLAELFEMTSEHVEMSRFERPPGTTKFNSV